MIEVRVHGTLPRDVLQQIVLVGERFPGGHQMRVVVLPADGGASTRRLDLGPEWRADPSAACLAALGEFGAVRVVRTPSRSSGRVRRPLLARVWGRARGAR